MQLVCARLVVPATAVGGVHVVAALDVLLSVRATNIFVTEVIKDCPSVSRRIGKWMGSSRKTR